MKYYIASVLILVLSVLLVACTNNVPVYEQVGPEPQITKSTQESETEEKTEEESEGESSVDFEENTVPIEEITEPKTENSSNNKPKPNKPVTPTKPVAPTQPQEPETEESTTEESTTEESTTEESTTDDGFLG